MTNKYHIVKNALRALYDVKRPAFTGLLPALQLFIPNPL